MNDGIAHIDVFLNIISNKFCCYDTAILYILFDYNLPKSLHKIGKGYVDKFKSDAFDHTRL